MSNNIRYFRAPTTIGDVWVTALRDGQVKIASGTGSGVHTEHDGGKASDLYVTVNKIQYDVDAWMTRQSDGTWAADHDFWIRREDYYRGGKRETSPRATEKAKAAIYAGVAEWLASDASAPLREAMARAERADAMHVVSQLEREVAELSVAIAARQEKLDAARMRLAVARGDVAECGCDLLAYPARYVCRHQRAES